MDTIQMLNLILVVILILILILAFIAVLLIFKMRKSKEPQNTQIKTETPAQFNNKGRKRNRFNI